MKRIYMLGGLILVLAGGWLLLGIWATSTMIGVDLPDAERGAEVSRYFRSEWSGIGIGVMLVLSGFWLGSRDPSRRGG